jgi:hypothetical protein
MSTGVRLHILEAAMAPDFQIECGRCIDSSGGSWRMVEANSHNVNMQKDVNYHKVNFQENCNESFTKNEQNSKDWNLKLLGEELSSMPTCPSSGSEFSIDSAELDSINNLLNSSWEKSKNSSRSQ